MTFLKGFRKNDAIGVKNTVKLLFTNNHIGYQEVKKNSRCVFKKHHSRTCHLRTICNISDDTAPSHESPRVTMGIKRIDSNFTIPYQK